MKNISSRSGILICFLIFISQLQNNLLQAQANIDFSMGSFTGWTGTYCTTSGGTVCSQPNPTQNAGFLPATPTLNASSISNSTTRNCQTLTSVAGGNDAVLAANGISMPVVFPGTQYAARLSSTWPQAVNDAPDAETMSYQFVVTPANCVFTYHYAVLLNDGGHAANAQPYFNITMNASTSGSIACAAYDVNASTAPNIGGFNTITDANGAGTILYKTWTSVTVPLNAYIGQTVTITFTTRSCIPCVLGICCTGPHWAIAYISAEVAPLQVVGSSPTVCGGQSMTLTAPAGAATYTWSTVPPGGAGIVSGGNTQVVTINQPGEYEVSMTTFGNTPCSFTIDTFALGDPANPVVNFSATTGCAGSPTSFTDHSTAPTTLTGWLWNFGDGSPTSSSQNPAHTYTTAGTYHVNLVTTASPCNHDTTIDVVIANPPSATFTASSPVCEGTNSSIQYTGGSPAGDTYTWSFSGGTVASGSGQGPYQVNWSTGGQKVVSLVVSSGACSSPAYTQTVTVNSAPGLVAPPDTSVCTGNSVTLVASNATTYSWAPNTGLSQTNTASVVATPATTTTYTVTGSSATCTATATVMVTVNPFPTSTFTVTPQVCANAPATVTYTGNAGAGANYTWNFNGGTAVPAGGQGPLQVTWSTAGNPNVTLTVAQSGCSSGQTSHAVTVEPIPASTFSVTSPLCVGANGTFTYTGTPSGTATYTWSFSGGNVVQGTGAGPYTVNWSVAGNPNVTLSVTDNGCNSGITTTPVIVNAVPNALFNASQPAICSGQTVTLTYTGTASAGATYNWGFAGGTGASGGTAQGPQVVSGLPAGVDSVTLTVTENGCTSAPDTVAITVSNTPTSAFTASGPICAGQTSTVTYTGTGTNAATYTWSFGSGTAVPGNGQGPQTVTFANAGTQPIGLVVSENGCTSQPTIQAVSVHPIPTATFAIPANFCEGIPGTINYTGTSSSAATLTWNFGGGNANPATGRGPIQISWATAGPETVSLSVVDSGCAAAPDTIPVTVNPVPASDAGTAGAYCSGGSLAIGAASTVGYTYTWSPASGLSSASVSNPTVNLTNTGNSVLSQTYTVTTESNSCSSTASVAVTVYPVPVVQFNAPGPACQGTALNFTAGGTFLPTATFAWTFGNAANPATSTSQTQSVNYTAPGTYGVTLTITQTAGSCADSTTDSVTIYPIPEPLITADTVYGCQNFEVCFTNNTITGPGAVYQWSFGDGATSGDTAPCHLYAAPGYYNVNVKATYQVCSADTTYDSLIHVIANPTALFTPSVTQVLQPQSEIDFTNQSLNASTYLWNFSTMGVNGNILGSTTDMSPTYNFTQYGLYNVMLYAYNALHCSDSTTQNVTVLPPNHFFVPNAFTPNGDGVNDEFAVELQEGATLRAMKIFDRWGEKVYDGIGPWDGKYMSKPCLPGVYVYELSIHLDTEVGTIAKKGTISLIR
jgi:gliding motility-associated-like protein